MSEPSGYSLSTDALSLSFGSHKVIRGIDLRVPRGSIYGFLGRNGAGKTSTIRMLMGILRPDSGTISFGPLTVPRTTAKMRASIGYVSQQQHFYPWMRVRRLSRFVGAFYPTWDQARFDSLCRDLAIPERQRVGELSGGTRMKLAMALAIAHRPPLLVLDEPTAGVDPVTRREILDLLSALAKRDGVTVLFSTHQISEIEDIGDSVGILHEGRIFWQGAVSSVAQRVCRVPAARIAPEAPEGLLVLERDERQAIVWGEPDRIAQLGETERISLETAFVAIARQDRSRAARPVAS